MIRLLTVPDAHALQTIRLLSLQTDALAFLSDFGRESGNSLEFYREKIVYNTRPPVFGVYGNFNGRELVATAQFSPDWHLKTRHLAHIYDLYVHPDHRRRQHAQILLRYLIELARTAARNFPAIPVLEQLHLSVNSRNLPAISLYEKTGFRRIGARPRAVKEPDNTYQDELLYCYYL